MKDWKHYLIALAGLLAILWAATFEGLPHRMVVWQCLARGNWAYHNRAYGDAEVWFRQALEKDPGFCPTFYHLGNALYQQGRYREAIGCYRQAQVNPGPSLRAALWANLGNAYYQAGRLNQSRWAYQNALVTSTNDLAIRQDFLFVQRKLAQRLSSQKPQPKDDPAAGSRADKKGAEEKATKEGVKQRIDPQEKGLQQVLSSKTMDNIFDQINTNESKAGGKLNNGGQLGKKVASDAKDY